eukprot:8248022-Ditylum_brightwellii.AAC.1
MSNTLQHVTPPLVQQFSSEVIMEHVLLPLSKSGLLDEISTSSLKACHPLLSSPCLAVQTGANGFAL